MGSPDWSLKRLKHLKEAGFQISLDDFGTGYSSMAYLHWMPLDYIKIDQSFVKPITADGGNNILCRSIIQLAENLGHKTIAEGVETPHAEEFLKQHQCDIGQGYHFGHPMNFEELLELLEQDPT